MWALLPPIFCVSFAVIGWQLALMRCLLIARYHHFSFLVISCALLGFGTGGVALALREAWFRKHARQILRWLLPSFGLSLPICFGIAEILPLNVYFPPNMMMPTVAWWCAFWAVQAIPFFLAGIFIGGTLTIAADEAHSVYAVNLAGSAAGALGTVFLMDRVSANGLVVPISSLVLISGFFLCDRLRARQDFLYGICLAVACLGLGGTWFLGPERLFPLQIDQYKTLAHVLRLERQGNAEKEASFSGVRGRVDVYSSPTFHSMLSMSPLVEPPPMRMLLRDGSALGSILSISSIDQARFLQDTLSALPYRLIHPKRVLILGAASGHYIWLARMSGAESIHVVQPDLHVIEALRAYGSHVLDDPRIRVQVCEPRSFLDATSETFDLIHLAELEGFLAGTAGIGSLQEDYLATVEGFAACLRALDSRGIVSTVRGIQEPERDNIKIAATWIAALRQCGVERPEDYMLVARDELALSTLVTRSAVLSDVVKKFLAVAREMSWEIEWFPGIKPEETNKIHVLPGPARTTVSWYHEAMRALLSPGSEDFLRGWIAQVTPATDDKPFFSDFFRWAGVGRLRETFGPMWATRSEMGFLVLVLSAVLTLVFAAILLPAPILLFRPPDKRTRWTLRFSVVCYFGLLGTGFMFVEMGFIAVFTRVLGDPILAAGLVVAGLLLAAGVGSMVQPAVTRFFPLGACGAAIGVALIVALYSRGLPFLFACSGTMAELSKDALALLVLAPMAFLMGVPFPWGLSVLNRIAAPAIPLAWAVNGFASVVSASVAVVVAMSWGFSSLLALASGLYVCAGMVSLLLKGADSRVNSMPRY